jgi:hypothetical protein
MAPQTPTGTPTDRRHPWNATFCTLLERIAWGRAATTIAERTPRCSFGVACLPVFAWDVPAAKVGRKGVAADGGKLTLPIRIRWSKQPPGAHPDGVPDQVPEVCTVNGSTPMRLYWEASGAGHLRHGVTKITASADIDDPEFLFADSIDLVPSHIVVPLMVKTRAVGSLKRLIDDGHTAQWEAISKIENHLSWAFERARASVRNELFDGQGAVVDDESCTAIKNEILLGGPTSRQKSTTVLRLLDRCLRPGTFERVDPERYVRTALVSGSETAIRRYIGDPHIGRKIRRLRAEREWKSADELVAEYRRRYPNDCLSTHRTYSALSAGQAVPQVVPLDDVVSRVAADG